MPAELALPEVASLNLQPCFSAQVQSHKKSFLLFPTHQGPPFGQRGPTQGAQVGLGWGLAPFLIPEKVARSNLQLSWELTWLSPT